MSMPIIPATCSWNPRAAAPLLLTCACAVFAGGCFTAKRPAAKLAFAAPAHPVIPPPAAIALVDAPEVFVEPEERVAPLVVPRGAPPRPRVMAVPAPERVAPEKSANPLMAPALTDAEMSAAKSATQNSLAIAERNLASTKGRSLNIAQQDLVSKIQGFVDSAREEMKNNDWPRAQIQAHKAEVLSQEIFPNP